MQQGHAAPALQLQPQSPRTQVQIYQKIIVALLRERKLLHAAYRDELKKNKRL